MTRSPVVFDFEGTPLVGTLHLPASGTPRAAAVLLNAGPAPRAGNSDLYVETAIRLAAAGVACVRVDLPGLGDSAGPSYATIEGYWHAVQQGCNDRAVGFVIAQARKRLGVERVVLGGLCAGAMSAVRACAVAPAGVAGLLLLEPNFRTSADTGPAARTDEGAPAAGAARRSRWRRALELESWLYLLTGDRPIARPFRPLRPLLTRALVRRMGHALPRDANLDLVVAWRRAAEAGVPTLVVCSEGEIADRYVGRIVDSFRPSGPRIERVMLHGSNHIFTAGRGRRDAAEAVLAWWLRLQPTSRVAP